MMGTEFIVENKTLFELLDGIRAVAKQRTDKALETLRVIQSALQETEREILAGMLLDTLRSLTKREGYADCSFVVIGAVRDTEYTYFIGGTLEAFDSSGKFIDDFEIDEVGSVHLHPLLNSNGKPVKPDAALGIDLRTGRVETHDSIDEVYAAFKISKP